jgi:hypothetical protein
MQNWSRASHEYGSRCYREIFHGGANDPAMLAKRAHAAPELELNYLPYARDCPDADCARLRRRGEVDRSIGEGFRGCFDRFVEQGWCVSFGTRMRIFASSSERRVPSNTMQSAVSRMCVPAWEDESR